jgi:hydroxylysine kinase
VVRVDVAGEALMLHWGIAAELRPLVSERDQNFLATASDGGKYVLKIANSAERPAVTALQNCALQHIENTAPGFPVPRVVLTTDGESTVVIRAQDGREHVARVLGWLEGTPLSAAGDGADIATSTGACLARLDRALCNFEHPASDHSLLWDMKRAAGLLDLLPEIADITLRLLCENRLQRFQDFVAPQLPGLRAQIIHNDLNPSNVLLDPGNLRSLAGVIDFGDIILSPLVVDVAVAAAYLCVPEEYPFAAVHEFLKAYTEVVPLQETEIALLYDLILTRYLMTVTITRWRAARYPENRDYILRNEPRARAMMKRVTDLAEADVTDRFLRVCQPA